MKLSQERGRGLISTLKNKFHRWNNEVNVPIFNAHKVSDGPPKMKKPLQLFGTTFDAEKFFSSNG